MASRYITRDASRTSDKITKIKTTIAMTQGQFISIEGIEGAGKSTVLDYIYDYLISNTKFRVIKTREPGGTEVAEEIRKILLMHLPHEENIQPETELLLMFASRIQHITHRILPALLNGTWVVCDRYIDATYAYQGGGRQIDFNFIKALDRQLVGQLYPNLTLLLDVPVEVGMARAAGRPLKKDRIESERFEFFEKVRAVYLQRANLEPKRVKIIDANSPLEELYAKVEHHLAEFISQKMEIS